MTKDELKNIALNLPQKPGIYQFFNAENEIIYIGKAKNLKNRVSSYFNKNLDRTKTIILVRQIRQIKYITVDTETDAFLLENTLINKHKPKYNIQLKDDKSYPWIVIKNEPFPRVFYTRNLIKDGSEYFGPYTSTGMVRTMVAMFKKLFKIRTCSLKLDVWRIENNKFKECLQYHIKNCLAPCIGLQTATEYQNNIEQIRRILKGKVGIVIEHVKEQMFEAAKELNFEKAEELKYKLDKLENYQSSSTVFQSTSDNIDVFSINSSEKFAYINFMKIVQGKIVQAYSTEIKKRLDESDKEILETAIIDIRQNIQQGISEAKIIIIPFEIDLHINNVSFKVPQRGLKNDLLKLSERNLKYFRKEKERLRNQVDPNRRTNEILEKMKKDLNLNEIPKHIECFDNSNIQGTNPVAACVVFKNGRPSKKDYRKFNIKTVVGADDFKSMREVVYRRYKRLIDNKLPLPQLIVIDGGKGQLSFAYESIKKLGLENKVAIISIAKRLEEIFRPNDPYPLYLDKNSTTLKIIQQARDEAHRFGITFHRHKRGKAMIKSQLTEISGIGEKTMQKLIKHFNNIENIKNASIAELTEAIGKAKGKIVFEFFNSKVS